LLDYLACVFHTHELIDRLEIGEQLA